jgi:hypothetical protein
MPDEEIVWTCSVCDKPVADSDGYLAVGIDEANRAERERQEWEDASPSGTAMSEMRTYPTAHWRVFHSDCDPEPERGPYRIEVDGIRSAWAVLAWTAHLMGEPWVSATDWRVVIEELAAAHGDTIA